MNKIFLKLLEIIYEMLKGTSISESAAYNPQKLEIISNTICQNLVVVTTLTLIAFFVWSKKRQWFAMIALFVTIVDLFIFSRGNLVSIPFSQASLPNKAADYLSSQSGYSRYLSTSGNIPYTGLGVYWTHLRAREPLSPNKVTDKELETFENFRKILAVLPENQGMQYQLFDAAGYAAAIPKNYLELFGSKISPNAIRLSDLSDDVLDIAGVKYIVTGYPEDYITGLINRDKFRNVFKANEIRIYENLDAWPRSFILTDNQKIATEILKTEPAQVIVRANTQSQGKLVLLDTVYPGWKVFIDGQEQPLESYRGVFRAVRISEGEHIVEFIFKPTTVKIGAIISLGTAVLLLVLWRNAKKLPLSFLTSMGKRTRSSASSL